MLNIYNSLTRKKEIFQSLTPGKVRLYVCGITVYDHCHLGHARSMVCFDVIVRFLRQLNYDVTFVKNITDIDDKIINKANQLGVSVHEVTQTYIDSMHLDMQALKCGPPTFEPRATTSIDAIITLIQRLLDSGIAYYSEEKDVCFEVARFATYGDLAHKDIDGLISGARVDIAKGKRSPLDFVLWKSAKPNEPSYESPFGLGRPGWHIECSAMVMEALGDQIDIHGGGLDLQFPHHENEIAQSESVTHKKLANYWMHVGMLQLNQEKMSKSTGNFLTIQDALKKHHPEVLRYFLLSSHYRSPLNYSEDNVVLAEKALVRLYQTVRQNPPSQQMVNEQWQRLFNTAMEDDFNTPVALSVLFELSHEVNKNNDDSLTYTLQYLANLLGLLEEDPVVFLQKGVDETDVAAIETLLAERATARVSKDFKRADEIRHQLMTQGIEIEDGPSGTTWKKL